MADILIRGMDMPKDGTYSIVCIYSDGRVSMPFWGKGMQVVSGITAVPVPPHGRLIDANALTYMTVTEPYGIKYTVVTDDDIDDAPTIIEATDGGEEK